MNHVSKSFSPGVGRVYRSHYWEQREGGFRREALIVGNGLWPAQKEARLVSFLLERGFRALSLDIAFGSPQAPRIRLASFRETIAGFATEACSPGLPLYLIASSFSGSALLPVAAELPGIAALALISPIVEFPPAKLKKPPFFLSTAELALEREDLSGQPELLEGFLEGRAAYKFHKGDLKAAAADIARSLETGFGLPLGAFAGEDDPLISQEGRQSLARFGAKVYGYPRVKREPGHDRYADNFYADLGSFLDQVEAGKAKRG